MVAEKLATLQDGQRADKLRNTANLPVVTRPQAAARLNVSERLLDDARAVRKASPKLAAEVERGEKTVTQAKREVRHAERRDSPSLPSAPHRARLPRNLRGPRPHEGPPRGD
jgi:hypothetical protein